MSRNLSVRQDWRAALPDQGFLLFEALQVALGHQATLAHNHIYGLLGLLREVDRSRICLDYKMPVEFLFRNVTYQMIHQSQPVKTFASIEGISQSRFSLESWVRDWSIGQEGKGRLLAMAAV